MNVAADFVDQQRDGPWDLPEGWCWATLDDVTDGPQYGWTTSAAGAGKVQFLRTTDISSGQVDWSTVPYCLEAPEDVERLALKDGDIVISRAGSVGKSFLIRNPRYAVFASYLIRFRPKFDAQYLHHFLQSGAYWAQIAEKAAGIAIPNVNGSKLRTVRLPLAPLAEQKRIVARIDSLFAEIAEGEAALDAARKGLDTFRRALLKAAVTGELTKDWRETNPVTETGHDLLARIRAERAAQGRSNGQAKGRGRRSPDAPPLDTAALPDLPEGWAWGTVGELAGLVEYGTSEKCDHSFDGIPVLRMGNVNFGSLDYSKLKFSPSGVDVPILQDGDLIFNRTNSAELVGKCAVYRSEIAPCSLASYLIRIRFINFEPEFAALWINSAYGRAWIRENQSQQVGQANLSGGTLKTMPIPIPPPNEAAEILRRVSEALAASADTLAMLDAEATDAARLKQSILKSAFEGRLVPQDLADEPASALLARLKATQLTAVRSKRARG